MTDASVQGEPMDEKTRVTSVSNWYLTEQLDFDKRLIGYRYQTLRPYFQGPYGLELGPAEGQMTRFLVRDFECLTVVEGALDLLEAIPSYPNLVKVHSLFEEFCPEKRFNTVFLEHILEHVDDPVTLLKRVQSWVAPGGRLLIGVPNGLSFHRLVAVKMGLLSEPCELNPRDLAQGHRRVYTQATLRRDIEAAGAKICEMGGVFFKPLANGQINDSWSVEMMDGFFALGKDFPENAADIYAVCEVS